jgi:hypothetical protein
MACNLAHVSARSWTFGSALDELSKAFMLGLMKRMLNGIGKEAKIVAAKTLGLSVLEYSIPPEIAVVSINGITTCCAVLYIFCHVSFGFCEVYIAGTADIEYSRRIQRTIRLMQ